MKEDELRAIVREAVKRHLSPGPAAAPVPSCAGHPSYARFLLPSGADADGPCFIEPAVACNHCEYCRSRGF